MDGRVEADPRLIEQAVRSVTGIAFAEVHPGEGEGLLSLVLWQGADAGECAYRIEMILRERFGIDLRPSDIRVVGYASPGGEAVVAPSGTAPGAAAAPGEAAAGRPTPELRIIELDGDGGTTWATEPVSPETTMGIAPAAPAEPSAESAGPAPPESAGPAPPESAGPAPPESAEPRLSAPGGSLSAAEERTLIDALVVERVVVTESGGEVEVRVELRSGGRILAGAAGGPATATRKYRSLCHATLRAVAAALPGVRLDLEHAAVVEIPEPAAVVVVTRLDASGERRLTGSALAARDPASAMVRATLASLR